MRGVDTLTYPCNTCGKETSWHYLAECWSDAKARLAHEDLNPLVPVDIDPKVRAILEGDIEP